jgi:hypothetical protein
MAQLSAWGEILAAEPLMLYVASLVTTQSREAWQAVSFRQLLSMRLERCSIIVSNNDRRLQEEDFEERK